MKKYFMRWVAVVPLFLLMPASAGGQEPDAIETLFWESVECKSRRQVQVYLEVYPTGRYVAEAWACLEQQLGLDRAARVLVQQGLAAVGYEPGPADGLFGGGTTRTRQAIRAWQAAKGMAETGYLTREQADALIALGQEVEEARRAAQAAAAREAQEEAARQRRAADEARAAQRQRPGPERVLAQIDAQMVRVPGGTFTMGYTREQTDCYDAEKPVHSVQVGSFEISRYEVTQEVWAAVMSENPSHFKNCPQCPVEQVSWDDVQEFLQKLNTRGGRYRLLSEAEWEYAARGGPQSREYEYVGSDNPDAVAWYEDNSGKRIHPVGKKQANELGLYDLSGNVTEWVQDCWNENYRGAPSNGQAWEQGDCSLRVLRGGSWDFGPSFLRPARRFWFTAVNRYVSIGFRIARSLP